MPKALHANMFLVRSAGDVMLRDLAILDEATTFDAFLSMSESAGGLRHVVVTRQTDRWRSSRQRRFAPRGRRSRGEVTLGELARRNFTLVREDAATSM